MRVVLALLSPLAILAVLFAATAAFITQARGVPADALRAVIEPVAWMPTLAGFVLVFLFTRWCAHRDGLSWSSVGWRAPRAPHLLAGAALGGCVAVLDAYWLHPWVRFFLPAFDPALAAQPLPTMLAVLLVSIVAEDTLFRGYAFERLRTRFGTAMAVLASTLAYAPLAGIQGLALVVWAFGFGAVLCFLRAWTGTLWPVVLAHGIVALAPRALAAA